MIDTANKFLVSVSTAGRVHVMAAAGSLVSMTPDDALLLAAYLVALSEHKADHPFHDVYEAVCNT